MRIFKISFYFTTILVILSLIVNACTINSREKVNTIIESTNDLPAILKKGKLVVLAENSSTSYFIYRGKKMGFEYELLKEFADELGLELEIKVVYNLDDMVRMLNNGEGDLIACNYTYTKERLKEIEFSEPFIKTPQVLVQKKPIGWAKMKPEALNAQLIRSPEKLAHKKIHVWKNSSYYDRLLNLQEEIGDTIFIEEQNGQMGTEEMIEMVSEGMIDYTVTEENVAQANEKFYENIDIQTKLSVKQKICFGLRKSNPLLKARIDKWLIQQTKKISYNYLKRKYFELSVLPSNSDFKPANLKRGEISAYDAIFKKVAAEYEWDWLILASISYHESRFNPNVRGFGGAYGMMQFMPSTGPKYGVYPNSTPEVQIRGGMKKLYKDYGSWTDITDPEQRYKFTLATYNAGRSHVEDAQRLAKKNGLNSKVWDDNVEKMMLNLSKQQYYRDPVVKNGAHHGSITYRYVREIYRRYLDWKAVVK